MLNVLLNGVTCIISILCWVVVKTEGYCHRSEATTRSCALDNDKIYPMSFIFSVKTVLQKHNFLIVVHSFCKIYVDLKVVRKRVFRFVDSEWKLTTWSLHLIMYLCPWCRKIHMLPTFWKLRMRTLHGCARKHEWRMKRQLVLKAKSAIFSVRWEYDFLGCKCNSHLIDEV